MYEVSLWDRKHDNHLALLNKMFNEDKIQDKIVKCKTMEEAFNIIKSYPFFYFYYVEK